MASKDSRVSKNNHEKSSFRDFVASQFEDNTSSSPSENNNNSKKHKSSKGLQNTSQTTTNTKKMAGRSGYLKKKGHVVKNMKKRWFVLNDGEDTIMYYKPISDPMKVANYVSTKPQGTISLRDSMLYLDETNKTTLLLDTTKEDGSIKQFWIEAETVTDRDAWVNVIMQRPNVTLVTLELKRESNANQK